MNGLDNIVKKFNFFKYSLIILDEKLVKMFKQSSQGRGMPLYNQDIFSDQSHSLLKQTISSSEYISPLVKALEDENQALKEEVFYFICYFFLIFS